MSSETEPTTVPLKLWVDKVKNHVVVAEATGDFVDILFSFLTLPLATVIRHVSKKQPTEIGCIKNLYKSVENLDTEVFWNNFCKQMLLCPRNPCNDICQKLKLNVDDNKEPTKYFMCSDCMNAVSTFKNARCTCGRLMDKEMKLHDSATEVKVNGAFVERKAMYLIFDDLKVMKVSLSDSLRQLVQLGYKDMTNLIDMSPKVGLNKILDLLKRAFTSKTPLTDEFLANVETIPVVSFSPKLGAESEVRSCILNLKITVSKSRNKVLYAEAEEDFIDFLLSFLTIPLGSILKLLDGNSSLGCVDNLYNSMKCLNPSFCHPGVASQFGCKNQPLNVNEQDPPGCWFSRSSSLLITSRIKDQYHNVVAMQVFEPRSPDLRKAIGFVKRPEVFVVRDDLTVTPLTSHILFLQKVNASLDDLEEHVLSIGETEALNLLRASLTSKAALTEGLFLLMKKPKQEID